MKLNTAASARFWTWHTNTTFYTDLYDAMYTSSYYKYDTISDDGGGMGGSSACSIFSGAASFKHLICSLSHSFVWSESPVILKNKNALKNSSNQNWNPSFIMEYIFQVKCNVSFFYFWKKTQNVWGIKNDNMSEKCCQTCQKVSY